MHLYQSNTYLQLVFREAIEALNVGSITCSTNAEAWHNWDGPCLNRARAWSRLAEYGLWGGTGLRVVGASISIVSRIRGPLIQA